MKSSLIQPPTLLVSSDHNLHSANLHAVNINSAVLEIPDGLIGPSSSDRDMGSTRSQLT